MTTPATPAPTPSPLVAALEHAVAVLRSLNAARGLVVERYTPVTAMLDRAIAQQSALMRSLNTAYEAEQAQAKGAPHAP